MKFILAVTAALAFITTGAQASTVFDLTGKGKWATELEYNQDSIGLKITPSREGGSSYISSLTDWLYQQNQHGVGMYSPGNGKDMEIDGRFANEMIQFVFDQAVTLVSITFGKVNKDDDFDFYFDGGSGLTEMNSDIDIPRDDQYIFSTLWTGTTFGFGANDRSDSFTIKKIEVAAANITAIPLPAALPLYGSGLALMGFLGWRRRQTGAAPA